MSRYIVRKLWSQQRQKKAGGLYVINCYLLDDGSEVESLEEFKDGVSIQVWYDEKWNKSKLKNPGGIA